MKRISISKLASIMAVLVGLYFVGVLVLEPLFRFVSGEDDIGDFLFMVVFQSLVLVPASFCIYFGCRLLMSTTKDLVKGTVGSLLAVLAVRGGIQVSIWFSDGEHEHLVTSTALLVATIVAIILHVVVCRAVVRLEGLPNAGFREFVSKTAIFLVAIQIWMLGNPVVDKYAPKNPDYPRLPEEPWGYVGFLVPILLAWGFYRFGMRYVERGKLAKPKVADRVLRAFGMQ
jgi:hypothetical protein